MTGNYEVNVEFIDPAMAAEMESIFLTDQSNCVRLTEEDWAARGVHRQAVELILAPLRPLL
jgi:cardiolipin synthase